MQRYVSLLLVFLFSTALAESGAYRVEVIVFRNLAVAAEPTRADELRSFSRFPDLLEPVAPADADATAAEPDTENPAETRDRVEEPGVDLETAAAIQPEGYRPDLPDDLLVVTGKSPAMDDAWRRLRGSRDYRPLLYAGWEQNRVDYYPPVRVHDQEVIDTRLRIPANITFATPAVADSVQTDPAVADQTVEDPIVVEPTDIDPIVVAPTDIDPMVDDPAGTDPTVTDPADANLMAAYQVNFYRLDGTVQLWRSRFLHVFLDIEYRETGPWQTPGPESPGGFFNIRPDEAQNPYTVFTLQQNRQVRTGSMQYFDTPQFGVLVLVTAIASKEAWPAGER